MKKTFRFVWWVVRYLPFGFMVTTWFFAFGIAVLFYYALLQDYGDSFPKVALYLKIFGGLLPFSYYPIYHFFHERRLSKSVVTVYAYSNRFWAAFSELFGLSWKIFEYVLAYLLSPILIPYMFLKMYLDFSQLCIKT